MAKGLASVVTGVEGEEKESWVSWTQKRVTMSNDNGPWSWALQPFPKDCAKSTAAKLQREPRDQARRRIQRSEEEEEEAACNAVSRSRPDQTRLRLRLQTHQQTQLV